MWVYNYQRSAMWFCFMWYSENTKVPIPRLSKPESNLFITYKRMWNIVGCQNRVRTWRCVCEVLVIMTVASWRCHITVRAGLEFHFTGMPNQALGWTWPTEAETSASTKPRCRGDKPWNWKCGLKEFRGLSVELQKIQPVR